MRTRHRTPTLFSLSMVDVFCCALGCVILLWLLNLREARERAEQAGQTDLQLASARQERDRLRAELEQARDELRGAEEDRRSLAARVKQAQEERDAARGGSQDAERRLTAKAAEVADLERKMTAAAGRVAALERELKDKNALLGAAGSRADGLAERLTSEEAKGAALAKDLARRVQELADANKALDVARAEKRDLDRDLTAATSFRDKLAAAEARVLTLEKDVGARKNELADAGRSIERLRAEADNRFAGITLGGRRVAFLIDTSGSMDLLNEKTQAPTKWPEVRATLAKVLRSMSGLEKFQVIGFADQPNYLLGEDGRWLDFDPKTSPDRVVQALAAIKPKGGTNLYAAFDTAFRLRAAGLDTIYVLSDGLPNLGEGLPPSAANLGAAQKSELLGKHVLRTLRNDWNSTSGGRSRVRVNAVGFFYESPDLGAFLWALARDNDGNFVGMSSP